MHLEGLVNIRCIHRDGVKRTLMMVKTRRFTGNRYHLLFANDVHAPLGSGGNGFDCIFFFAESSAARTSFSSVPGETVFPQEVFDRSMGTISRPASSKSPAASFPAAADDDGVSSSPPLYCAGKRVRMLGNTGLGVFFGTCRGKRME